MNELFDSLLVSSPNGGGLFLVKEGRIDRLDTFDSTGLDTIGGSVFRAYQPNGLSMLGSNNWSTASDNIDDIHDVLIQDDTLYVVGTAGNEIVELDLEGHELRRTAFSLERDSWHINCVAVWNSSLVFSAFGDFLDHRGYKGSTDRAGFVQELRSQKRIIKGLSQPHSLTPHRENLLLANSECKEIREYASSGRLLRNLALNGYTRGICVSHDVIYVGLSCSRNIDEIGVTTATIVALDRKTWSELGRIALPTKEIYTIKEIAEPHNLIRALGSLSEANTARYICAQQKLLTAKDAAWSARLKQCALDYSTEINRIAAERDAMLADKDIAWAARLEQTATDYAAEIARVAAERDVMLADKDVAWAERLEQTAIDYSAETARVAAERDAMLADKDVAWAARLEQAAIDYSAEIARVAAERDAMLADKDIVWSTRLEQTAKDLSEKIDHVTAGRDYMLTEKDIAHEKIVKDKNSEWSRLLTGIVPQVSVISVNFNGKRFLPGLIQSISKQTLAPAEIIIVDNASSDGSVEFLQQNFPNVKVVKSDRNLGFAAGNNLGVQAATSPLLALINNDTEVSATWLEHLVASWSSRTAKGHLVGAVSPKIRFFKKFLSFRFRSTVFSPGCGDDRALGVAIDLSRTKVEGVSYIKPIIVSGFHDEEHWPEDRIVRWTSATADLMLPVDNICATGTCHLHLVVTTGEIPDGVDLDVECEGYQLGSFKVKNGFSELNIEIPSVAFQNAQWITNNAGTRLDRYGNAADIGINQPDCGQFENTINLDAFCGCSVLIPREIFLSLGGFDDRFFMYYEDVDLSWRMRRNGLCIAFEPRSVVHHIHAGSSGEWSPSFRYYVTRNYRLNGLKNARLPQLLTLITRLLYSTLLTICAGGGSWHQSSNNLNSMTPSQIEFKALKDAIAMAPSIILQRIRSLRRKR